MKIERDFHRRFHEFVITQLNGDTRSHRLGVSCEPVPAKRCRHQAVAGINPLIVEIRRLLGLHIADASASRIVEIEVVDASPPSNGARYGTRGFELVRGAPALRPGRTVTRMEKSLPGAGTSSLTTSIAFGDEACFPTTSRSSRETTIGLVALAAAITGILPLRRRMSFAAGSGATSERRVNVGPPVRRMPGLE